jgi:hypothetical protein
MTKYVIWKSLAGWQGSTLENYNAYIQDARKIHKFDKNNGFGCVLDVKNFVKQFFKYSDNEIIIKE